MAFVSSDNTSSTNEAVNTAHDVSGASSQGQAFASTYANDVMLSFFTNQSNSPQLDNEDLEQIDTNDLKRWISNGKWSCLPSEEGPTDFAIMAFSSSGSSSSNTEVQFRRTSLTGFPTQSIRSSNAITIDSPYLLVLITETSQSRQHVDTSLIHLESRKSPTAELFDVDS
nr:hypothetical protein [Tanacetum cinerariifolium]